jgi:hypothetical protein
MLRLHNNLLSLWEAVLAPELVEMGEELTKIDRTPNDRFFAPFRRAFYNQAGRPIVLVVTRLRMMAKAPHSQSSTFACGLLDRFQSGSWWGKHS